MLSGVILSVVMLSVVAFIGTVFSPVSSFELSRESFEGDIKKPLCSPCGGTTFSLMTFSPKDTHHNRLNCDGQHKRHSASALSVVMLRVIMLRVNSLIVMLIVIMLNVIMLGVEAPSYSYYLNSSEKDDLHLQKIVFGLSLLLQRFLLL
jgi:hypothetical protein